MPTLSGTLASRLTSTFFLPSHTHWRLHAVIACGRGLYTKNACPPPLLSPYARLRRVRGKPRSWWAGKDGDQIKHMTRSEYITHTTSKDSCFHHWALQLIKFQSVQVSTAHHKHTIKMILDLFLFEANYKSIAHIQSYERAPHDATIS